VAWVMSALALQARSGGAPVEVREDAQARFNADLARRLERTVWGSGCKSWYLDPSGRNSTLWPGFTFEFRARTRRIDPRTLVGAADR
jgi:hypothetical protein